MGVTKVWAGVLPFLLVPAVACVGPTGHTNDMIHRYILLVMAGVHILPVMAGAHILPGRAGGYILPGIAGVPAANGFNGKRKAI